MTNTEHMITLNKQIIYVALVGIAVNDASMESMYHHMFVFAIPFI